MKVGDLVRDTDLGDIGVILEVADNAGSGIYKVVFTDKVCDWYSDAFLEVISEKR